MPHRWAKVNELFYAALEKPPEEWTNFLQAACGGDIQLQSEVESLLAAHKNEGSFIQKPAIPDAIQLLVQEYNESMNANEDLTGRVLSHYRILKRLGSGGMGEVYLAEDTQLDRKIALKVLPPEFASDPNRMKRFVREAKAASAIDHSNIVHIYEINEVAGVNFIAMQYVEGETLASKIGAHALSIDETLRFAIQIADAITEAHLRGIIHRDLKPANVMISSKGDLKLLDFGLARIERIEPSNELSRAETLSKTAQGSVLGTVGYMSPEQALGKNIDHRTDIFSMGIVFYEMVTGKPPFLGHNAAETIDKIVHNQPNAISRLNYDVPAELERIIRKCMEKDPTNRYQSTSEVLIDLRSLKRDLDSSKVTTDKAGPGVRTVPSKHTNPRYLVFIALIVAAAIGICIAMWKRTIPNQGIESIAVLPFVNVTQDPNSEYLCDGLTESIIKNLSQISKVRVMAPVSVFRFKGKQVDPQKVGSELKVKSVLTGRVLQHADNLVVNVDLVNTGDGTELWGNEYSRKLSDIFALQSDIAQEISSNLRLKLTGQEMRQLAKHYTNNNDAYRFYLEGLFYFNKRTPADISKAADYFQRAIERDPEYALAYVGLADVYNLMDDYLGSDPDDTFPKARTAARKALEIDDQIAEAHTSLATVYYYYNWDWDAAEREFRAAIRLNPNYAFGHQLYGDFLASMGKLDHATTESNLSLQLDPLSLSANLKVGIIYFLERRFPEASKQLEKVVELDPSFQNAYHWLADVYKAQGKYQESIPLTEKYLSLRGISSEKILKTTTALRQAFKKSGSKGYTQKVLELSMEDLKTLSFDEVELAGIYSQLGEKDKAFELLEKAYRKREAWLLFGGFLKAHPQWDPIRSDPRFKDLLHRMHLPT